MEPISQEKALSNLREHFHDDFHELSKTMLQANEAILWTGNFSFRRPDTVGLIGYGILTSIRFIWVWFIAHGGLITGRRTVKLSDMVGYVESPKSNLRSNEKKSRVVHERLIKNIDNVSMQIYKHNDTMAKDILEIRISGHMFGQQFIFDKFDIGLELYNYLLEITKRKD